MKEAEVFSIICPKKANLDNVYGLLANVEEVEVRRVKDRVVLSLVERTNIRGELERVILMEFFESSISITYSIEENEPPSFRRWEVIKKVLPIIEIVAEEYALTVSSIFPILDKIVGEINLDLSKTQKDYYVELDRLRRELSETRKKIMRCKSDNERLSKKIFELNSKIADLKGKLAKYESMSEELLKTKIMEWLREHHGEINIPVFSKVYKVKESYVEEVLDKLIKEGHISPI